MTAMATTGRARHLPLAAVLLVAAALRAWRLDQNGYDNEYYAAAVRSMSESWHNFLYNSFDPAGFVSVDKPPVALWIQVASVKVFGFHGWSVLLPQVLEGLASVALVYHLVQRRFGTTAGLVAGFFMAITPVSVAVDRSGNTDTCLVLVLLLAAWALTRAAESASRPLLLLSTAVIGLGFNVKMLAAFVVLPTFALVYVVGAPLPWRRRLADLTLAGIVLIATSLPWTLAYDLTAAERRPYAGSSSHNSMVELAIGHNAVGRFVRPAGLVRASGADTGAVRRVARSETAGADPGSPTRTRVFVRAPTGPLRLADGLLAAQAEWLLPLALAGILVGRLGVRARRPIAPEDQALILWIGWALTYGVVYSAAGGIFHFYYLATLAPPLAALAGIGVARGWNAFGGGGWRAAVFPAALLLTAAWQTYVQWGALRETLERSRSNWTVIYVAPAATAILAILLLLLVGRGATAGGSPRGLAAGTATIAVLGLLPLPIAWALSSVVTPGIAVLPSADLYRLTAGYASEARARARSQDEMLVQKLTAFLARSRQGEQYLVATSSARLAAPIIIETGAPVMARGGFHGLDLILTPDELSRLVDARVVRYAMLGDLSPTSRRLGGEAAGQPIADWIRAHGQPVDPSLWRPDPPTSRRLAARIDTLELYDLRPGSSTNSGR